MSRDRGRGQSEVERDGLIGAVVRLIKLARRLSAVHADAVGLEFVVKRRRGVGRDPWTERRVTTPGSSSPRSRISSPTIVNTSDRMWHRSSSSGYGMEIRGRWHGNT